MARQQPPSTGRLARLDVQPSHQYRTMHTFIEQLIRTWQLDAARSRQLWQLSGLLEPPPQLHRRLFQGLALAAALLLGAGLVFFVAANWQAQTHSFKLMLLQAAVLAPALATALWPRARAALLLLATLALGALLAFVGQTWQTGADAWQLFALWTLLALPWVALARTDWLWGAWNLIAATAIASWAGLPWDMVSLGRAFGNTGAMRWFALLLWAALFLWPMLLPTFKLVNPSRFRVSWAMATFLALGVWVTGGLADLLDHDGGAFYAANLMLAAAAFFLAWRVPERDWAVLGLTLMALNALLLGWLAYGLFSGSDGDWLGRLILFTLITAAAVGGSGTWLYRLQRAEGQE